MAENTLNNANLPLNQNPASIYYIHPSDANSIQLVSFKFNGDGFTSWKRAMLLMLSPKNKAGFVNGNYTKPVDETSLEHKAWERCNDLCDVLEINKGSLARSGRESVWDAIDEANPLPYCTCNNYTCNLTKKIFERHQAKMVIQFMMKLSDKFGKIRGNMLMMPTLPKITEAYRMFAQEEKHREIAQLSNNPESMAFLAEKRKFRNFQKQNNYSQFRNFAGEQKIDKPGSRYYCTHCEIPGHSIHRCFKLKGFPPSFKGFKDKRVAAMSFSETEDMDEQLAKPITVAQYNQIMTAFATLNRTDSKAESSKSMVMMVGNICFLSCSDSKWLLDSGATDHICSDIKIFIEYKVASNMTKYITILDGSRVLVKHIGVVKLNNDIFLHNVLHVPDFKFNLISMHKLCKDLMCELHFTHDRCFVHTQRGQSIPLGSLSAGLYKFQKDRDTGVSSSVHAGSRVCLAAVEDAKLWHLRLVYLINRMPLKVIGNDIPFKRLKDTDTEHWCNLVIYDNFPDNHKCFIAHTCDDIHEPLNYAQAVKDPLWVEAMQKDIDALVKNGTWILVDLPKGKEGYWL
ncbi:uncharacterized protein LOC110734579 [Chenopodium quinoa]|uniref:uncharacterized protein LOC110734579 n=1 Tax=Chenopodium quinoa TaxID=63459 RepID=UPI000B787271|nr:uncharacterized protein LOC110734579 [Chenopodium quinoa]